MAEVQPVKARYIGYVKDTENHGDEALIWILKDLLAPEIEVSTDTDDFAIAILGGGTLINQSPWLMDWFAEHQAKARHSVVFGTGVGDPLFWGDNVNRWNNLLKHCIRTGVRGPHSAQLLADHGFNRAEMIGDPYLVLQPPMEWRPAPKRLAVNFGTANGAILGGDEAGFLKFVQELLTRVREDGWSIVWISVWSQDLKIMRQIRQAVGVNSGPLLDARSDTLEALSALSRCTVLLGEKLHALAMGAVTGTPFLAWEYQPKVRDFCASLDMEKLVLSTKFREVTGTKRRLEDLAQQGDAVAKELLQSTAVRRRSILEFASELRRWAGTLEGT